jgi:hypothetical protein
VGQGGTFLCVEADVTLFQSALQATKLAINRT